MKSLTPCQKEASCGLSSASRMAASSRASSEVRSAAGLDVTGARNSRIRNSATSSLFASGSDDRARNRSASRYLSRRLMRGFFGRSQSAKIASALRHGFPQNRRGLGSLGSGEHPSEPLCIVSRPGWRAIIAAPPTAPIRAPPSGSSEQGLHGLQTKPQLWILIGYRTVVDAFTVLVTRSIEPHTDQLPLSPLNSTRVASVL